MPKSGVALNYKIGHLYLLKEKEDISTKKFEVRKGVMQKLKRSDSLIFKV